MVEYLDPILQIGDGVGECIDPSLTVGDDLGECVDPFVAFDDGMVESFDSCIALNHCAVQYIDLLVTFRQALGQIACGPFVFSDAAAELLDLPVSFGYPAFTHGEYATEGRCRCVEGRSDLSELCNVLFVYFAATPAIQDLEAGYHPA